MLLSGVAFAAEPRVLPLPWLDGPCHDLRYPRLAGEWAVGCGPSGRVDRVLYLESRRTVLLSGAAESPAVAPGVLYAPTRDHGLWRLPSPEVEPDVSLVPLSGLAPPATDGEQAVLAVEEGLQVFRFDERLRRTYEATPAPWYPPAIAGSRVAWVDLRDGSEDVYVRGPDGERAVAAGPGHERHVALSGDVVAWIDDEGVSGLDLVTGEGWRVVSDAHTSRRLSLDGGVACWEAWNGLDVDVVCSDGLTWGGPGDQRNPSRQGSRLLVVDDGHALLLVFATPESDEP